MGAPRTAPDVTAAPDMAAIVTARICHDLVSPLGALGNGLELLQLAGTAAGPELVLMRESIAAATARMRLFRVAFGGDQPGSRMSRAEVGAILDGLAPGARALVSWQPTGALPRDEVRLALLLLMCLETTLPYGGGVTFARDGDAWAIRAEAGRMALDEALWAIAAGRAQAAEMTPRNVQFALVPGALATLGRRLVLHRAEGGLTLRA